MNNRQRTTITTQPGKLAIAIGFVFAGLGVTGWLLTLPNPREATLSAVIIVPPTFAMLALAFWQLFGKTSPKSGFLRDYETYLTDAVRQEWTPWRIRTLGSNVTIAAQIGFYENLNRYHLIGVENQTKLNRVLQYYQNRRPSALIIQGAAGTGKTVLCIEFLFSLLKVREGDFEQPVPVLLNLSGWQTATPLVTWIAQQVSSIYGIPRKISNSLLLNGRIIAILDELENVLVADDSTESLSPLSSLADAINGSLRGRIIITCRDNDYAPLRGLVESARAQVLRIANLKSREAAHYLESRYPSISSRYPIQSDWEPVYRSLLKRHSGVIGEAFSTPWRLSLAALAVDAGTISPVELLAFRSVSHFDEELLPRFIPASIKLRPSVLTTKLHYSSVQIESSLITLASYIRRSQLSNQTAFTPSKLRVHQLWPIAGRGKTQALHGSISVLGGALLVANGAEFASGSVGLLSACVYALTGAGLGAWAAMDHNPKPSRLSLQRLHSWRTLAVCAVFATAEGVLNSLVGGPAVGLTVGLLCLAAATIVAGFRAGIGGAPRTGDRLLDDLIFGLALGVTIGLAAGLPGGLTGGLIKELGIKRNIGLIPSIFVALLIGLLCGISIGARSWTRYKCASVIWSANGKLPFRLRRLMREACELDILRASGDAYQFRHQIFARWLLSKSSTSEGSE